MPVLVGAQPWARHTQLSQSSACRISSMEGCLWTSCTLPVQHHPTQATGPQFPTCTCVEAEPTLVSRTVSQDPPGGLQEEESPMQLPTQPPAPTSPPPQHSHHSLPRAAEPFLAAAPARLPEPSPTLSTGTGHGRGHRELCSPDTGTVQVILSSVAQNTQEGCT